MRTLLLQQLRDRRAAIAGWLAGWLVLVGMYVATWPTVKAHGAQYDQILRDLPAALRSAVGNQADGAFSTPAGYLTAELLAVTGPLVATTMGVLLGAGALARSEEDGTLEILLVQPVSRRRLLLCRVGSALVELLGVLTVTGLALFVVGRSVHLGLDLQTCLRATAMLALLGTEAMSLALLAGAVTGRAARARALAGGVALVVFLLSALGPSISWLADLVVTSPFHTLVASDPFRRLPPAPSVLALLGPAVLFVLLAARVFDRRDLKLR